MGITWSSKRRSSYLNGYPPVPGSILPPAYVYASESHPSPASHLIHPYHNYIQASTVPYPPPACVPHNCYLPCFPSTTYACYPPCNAVMVRPSAPIYVINQSNCWTPMQTSVLPLAEPPSPLPENENAQKVRSDINVRKDTLQLEIDEQNRDHHLVSFVFDALSDGSFTIAYFANEDGDGGLRALYPQVCRPVTVPFLKGLGQRFLQPPGAGVDLGFIGTNAHDRDDGYSPLIVSARPHAAAAAQLTHAVLERKSTGGGGSIVVPSVVRQVLLAPDGTRYELRDIYGIGTPSDPPSSCVVCMNQPKDTALLPCRHMCLCFHCAGELRIRSNNCPICRHPIDHLLQIFS